MSRLIPADTDSFASCSSSSAPAMNKPSSGITADIQAAGESVPALTGVGPSNVDQAEKLITYSWFGRVFKKSQLAVRYNADGLTLTSLYTNRLFANQLLSTGAGSFDQHTDKNTVDYPIKNGAGHDKDTEIHFNWQQLDKPAVFNWSFFGYLMSFTVGEKIYTTPFLSYDSKSKFSNDMDVYWAVANRQGLCELVARIEKAMTHEYLRRSRIKMITARIAREYARWFPWSQNPSLELPQEIQAALSKLKQFKAWTEQDIENIREQYVQLQLITHKAFFDNVESNPLTEKQRRACIIDDNNNLLLAGAGTGKTSVMVGRAGYLIQSGQANASEVLLLAYGKVAAKEMEERIKLKLGSPLTPGETSQPENGVAVNDIRVSTFHSLGMRIITEVEGATPKLSAWVNDDKGKDKWLNDTLGSLLNDTRYRKTLLAFLGEHFHSEMSPFNFENEQDYLAYLSANDIRSFMGDKVNSFAEMQIANWLFKQGIEYQHQASYQHKSCDKTSDKRVRQYKSNFYLPHDDLYIDYFTIDETGLAPVFIDNDSYQDSIEWKRELHSQNKTHYVDLYHHQHNQGQLLKVLSKRLSKYRVKRAPIDDETLLDQLQKQGYITKLAKLFGQVLTLYRGACLDDKSLAELLSSSVFQKQTEAAFKLIKPILKSYRAHLNANGEIDFEDMIAKAIEYIEKGEFISPWRFIMVDEFQDISEPRARLVRALRDSTHCISKEKHAKEAEPTAGTEAKTQPKNLVKSGRSASLFCVGDDWQAIYRFSGADVKLTTQFEHYFGPVTKSHLDLTFRFNSRIGDVATRFITQNPMQLKKTINSVKKGIRSAVTVVKPRATNKQAGEKDQQDAINQNQFTNSTLTETLNAINQLVSKEKGKPEAKQKTKQKAKQRVYLLARYWFVLPNQQELALLNQAYPGINIECQSFHASKGKEADYVIIMGLTTGVHGFPSLKTTPPVVDALLPEAEDFHFAEERRLFYVALTRAKHKVYLLADNKDVSPFVGEISQLCRSQV